MYFYKKHIALYKILISLFFFFFFFSALSIFHFVDFSLFFFKVSGLGGEQTSFIVTSHIEHNNVSQFDNVMK